MGIAAAFPDGNTEFQMLPFPIPDLDKLVGMEDHEDYSADGTHIRGVTAVEYLSKAGAVKHIKRPFFRCVVGGEKVYGHPGAEATCSECRKKKQVRQLWVYATYGVVGIAAVTLLGMFVMAVAPYLMAGLLAMGAYWAHKSGKEKELR